MTLQTIPRYPSISFDQKLVTRKNHLVVAFVLAIICFVVTIATSYSALKNVISTKRVLMVADHHANDLKLALSDSVTIINDYRAESRKNSQNTRLKQIISNKALNSVNEISSIHRNLAVEVLLLEATDVWDDVKWLVSSSEGALAIQLHAYLDQMRAVTSAVDNESGQPYHVPLEAAGARYGTLFRGYQDASNQLRALVNDYSSRVEMVHRIHTIINIFVVLLISMLVVAPLWIKLYLEQKKVQKAHSAIKKIAFTDRETGLPNLYGLANNNRRSSFRDRAPSYLLLVRVRNLDEIYHLISGRRVESLFRAISSRLRNFGLFDLQWSRSGEAEFSCIIADSHLSNSADWAQMLYTELTANLKIDGIVVRPEVCMAVSRLSGFQNDASHLWEHQSNARLALLNFDPPVCWLPAYHSDLKKSLTDQNEIILQIGEGLKRGEFLPFYQLKVDAKTGVACSVEVLARWIRSDGSIVSPGVFIPIAESTGHIVMLTYAIFDQVLVDVRTWCEDGIPVGRVAVNIASAVLHDEEFVERLAMLSDGLPALCEGLEIEITENIAIDDNFERTETILQDIRALGIAIAIDDFGTGYASLQTLIDLPFDVLKIDRSFVRVMTESGDGHEVVSAMLSLANQLKKKSVVEGVETDWQWRDLASMGADELQGFYFHKPVAASEIATEIQKDVIQQMTA